MRKVLRFLALNPESGLGSQILFWIAILAPIAAAAGFSLPIWVDYELTFNAKAYNYFLELSKLPLGIAALSIPLGVLVARMHGTKQTAKQIAETMQDNKIKLFLSHYGYFCNFVEKNEEFILDKHNLDRNKWRILQISLYHKMYPGSSIRNGVNGSEYKFLKGLMSQIETTASSLLIAIESTKVDEDSVSHIEVREQYLKLLASHNENVNSLLRFLCLSESVIIDNNKSPLSWSLEDQLRILYFSIDWYLALFAFSENVDAADLNTNIATIGMKITSIVDMLKHPNTVVRKLHATPPSFF
ncbi:hypothetical protein KCG43_11310 [Photobacterium sp. WH24]|uniref:hypothetical protein n=1 Tax=Photobacterium sp. WH24 TaxID=2827237 RepID=UPI001C479770|nr:hypothetical protein [Photobacterium sp. WH24]MBV7262584.1 hypothetical protein [Photobacterium sp. WH24]